MQGIKHSILLVFSIFGEGIFLKNRGKIIIYLPPFKDVDSQINALCIYFLGGDWVFISAAKIMK